MAASRYGRFLLVALLLLAASPAFPGPIAQAMDMLQTQFLRMVHRAASAVGPLLMLFGGGRAAWIAYQGEDWVWPFIQAILGTAIFAAAA
jgi:hypothetical protein